MHGLDDAQYLQQKAHNKRISEFRSSSNSGINVTVVLKYTNGVVQVYNWQGTEVIAGSLNRQLMKFPNYMNPDKHGRIEWPGEGVEHQHGLIRSNGGNGSYDIGAGDPYAMQFIVQGSVDWNATRLRFFGPDGSRWMPDDQGGASVRAGLLNAAEDIINSKMQPLYFCDRMAGKSYYVRFDDKYAPRFPTIGFEVYRYRVGATNEMGGESARTAVASLISFPTFSTAYVNEKVAVENFFQPRELVYQNSYGYTV
ncbi:polyhedrin [Heliothis armigera cypovirus 5]|uniref:Polyhedrin n=3 Tax=Cypovirus 5 TaxID=205899 RepID=PYHD_CPVOP|nr:polyhedrin [Cypovirus 5]P36701.1 RecName: Full=Polyhedrin; AltName: Full=C-polyhedrin [Orgyia pseudotsugata cypovirus 5]AAA50751.1 C-polyhedron protein [Heliothis armigera cypovirus 8]AAY96322.1 polyhedrin [Heliothis armigera cypovirus 5]AAA50750.1 C-polyhedron protein [Orgyia pseudotsugata cypovirus 5]AHJ14790.1 polyhedrin [Orgyia pseudotsugata cypovirus 5]